MVCVHFSIWRIDANKQSEEESITLITFQQGTQGWHEDELQPLGSGEGAGQKGSVEVSASGGGGVCA